MANYTVKFTNVNAAPITILEGDINVVSTDIALFGRARLEYGEQLNETLLHLLENFSCHEDGHNPGNPDLTRTSSNLLSTPTMGQFWYNKSVGLIYYWDGSSWLPLRRSDDVTAVFGTVNHGEQIARPVSPVTGHVYTYDECIWSVAPAGYIVAPLSMTCSTDSTATVTMTYDMGGIEQAGTVNYLIIGIRGNVNLGIQSISESGIGGGGGAPLPPVPPPPPPVP